MQERAPAGAKPPEERTPAERSRLRAGETHWDLDDTQQGGPVPRQPNERDESSDSQAMQSPSAQHMAQRAAQDARGIDTDRGPVLEALYDRTLRTVPEAAPEDSPVSEEDYGGLRPQPSAGPGPSGKP
jgi:hypothetical protein